MAADEFRGRVHDDVGTVKEWLGQVRGRQSVVDHERNLVLMGDACNALEIEHVALRIPECLGVKRLCVRSHGRTPGFEVIRIIDECRLDPQFRQRVVEEVVRAP